METREATPRGRAEEWSAAAAGSRSDRHELYGGSTLSATPFRPIGPRLFRNKIYTGSLPVGSHFVTINASMVM